MDYSVHSASSPVILISMDTERQLTRLAYARRTIVDDGRLITKITNLFLKIIYFICGYESLSEAQWNDNVILLQGLQPQIDNNHRLYRLYYNTVQHCSYYKPHLNIQLKPPMSFRKVVTQPFNSGTPSLVQTGLSNTRPDPYQPRNIVVSDASTNTRQESFGFQNEPRGRSTTRQDPAPTNTRLDPVVNPPAHVVVNLPPSHQSRDPYNQVSTNISKGRLGVHRAPRPGRGGGGLGVQHVPRGASTRQDPIGGTSQASETAIPARRDRPDTGSVHYPRPSADNVMSSSRLAQHSSGSLRHAEPSSRERRTDNQRGPTRND